MIVRWRALRSLVAVSVLAFPAIGYADDKPAHAIANTFAKDSERQDRSSRSTDDRQVLERKLEDEARLKADEAEMLERAKAEAEERRKADEAADDKAARERAVREAARIRQAEKLRLTHERDEADRRKAEEAARLAKADEERRAAEAEQKRLAEERLEADRRKADEAARLAKAEDQRRATEAEQQRQAAARAEADRMAAEAETARLAEVERIKAAEKKDAEVKRAAAEAAETERKRMAAERAEKDRLALEAARQRIEQAKQADALRRMEAEREAEARQLSEKLARARERRETAKELGPGYSALGKPPSDDELDRTENGRSRVGVREKRATLLLALEPGSRGIRRYEKTADPVICLGNRCYISSGAEDPAREMTRGRALGPGNTLGQRAGACRHSLTCVFRDVDVGGGNVQVQPIDLRLLRHDRREVVTVTPDETCTVTAGRLKCSRGIVAGSYRIWVVPESVARRAGAGALQSVLADGLAQPRTAERGW